MKVYLAIQGENDGNNGSISVLGVYTSFELAKEFLEKQPLERGCFSCIDEYEIDKPPTINTTVIAENYC